MKINLTRSWLRETSYRAETKSNYSGNLFFRPSLEYLEDRRLLSVSPQVAENPIEAAVTPTTNSSLAGFVYVDSNNNGTEDPGELGILDAVVVLTGTPTAGGTVNLSTVTDSTGHYSFANLQPGNYTITETQPTNYIEGKDAVGSQASGTITQTATTNTIGNITLNSGVSGTHNDFGNVGFTLNNVTKRSFMFPPLPIPTDPIDSLSIVKTDNAGGSSQTNTAGNVVPSQTLKYTLVVTNTGQAAQTGVTISDQNLTTVFPTGDTWTATSTTGATGFTATGSGNIDDTHVSLPIGSSVTYVITGTVSSTATTSISNTAFVTPSGGTAIPATDTDNLPTETIDKSDDKGGTSNTQSATSTPAGTTGTVSAGQTMTYKVVVSNTGPGNDPNATIADLNLTTVFPAGDSWTASSTGVNTASGFSTGTKTGNIDDVGVDLPANSQVTYTITGIVGATTSGTISNTASVTSSGGTKINAVDNDSMPTETIKKSDNKLGTSNLQTATSTPSGVTGNVVAGQSMTYTVVVSNTGPGPDPDATIADLNLTTVFPAGDSWTASSTGVNAASGFSTGTKSGNIDDVGVDLPANSQVTYVITGIVGPTATGTISNTASVTSSGGTKINAVDNDNMPTETIEKSDNKLGTSNLQTATSTPAGVTGNVVAGQTMTYTVVVSNTGPGNDPAATIADLNLTTVFPGGDSWTAASTGVNTASGFSTGTNSGNIDDTAVDLPANSQVKYTITGVVGPTATGTISNTASVTSSGGTKINAIDNDNMPTETIEKFDDANGTSNLQTATNTPAGTPGSVTTTQMLTYRIVVSNTGPGNDPDAAIADLNLTTVFPAGDSWTASSTGVNTASGFSTGTQSGNINDMDVDLPANSQVTYVVTGKLNIPTDTDVPVTSISNTASVTSSGGTKINATDNDDVIRIGIDKFDDAVQSTVAPSQVLTYTVIVSNKGLGTETVNISDAALATIFPGGDTWTAASTGVNSFSGFVTSSTGTINQNVVMPPNTQITYTIVGTVSPTAADESVLTNQAIATPTNGNAVMASVADTVGIPDLSIRKSDDQNGDSGTQTLTSNPTGTTGNVNPGQTVNYSITVSNTGDGPANNEAVSDMFPSNLSNVSYSTTTTGVGVTDSHPTGAVGVTNITDTVTLPAGTSITYHVIATVIPTAIGQLTNKASVTPPGGTKILAIDVDNISGLEITKSDDIGGTSGLQTLTSSGTPSPGSTSEDSDFSYMITVQNNGTGFINNATISDTFPSGFSETSWTSVESGGAAGATNNNTAGTPLNDTVDLPSGGKIVYTINGEAVSFGPLSNTATVAPTAGSGSSVSATDNDNISEEVIEVVPVGGLLTTSAVSGAGKSNTAAVDTAMAGIGFRPLTPGAPAFGPVQFDAKDFRVGPLPMVVDAALAGNTGWRPSSQVSAAIDALLGGQIGMVQIDQDSDSEPLHGSHHGH